MFLLLHSAFQLPHTLPQALELHWLWSGKDDKDIEYKLVCEKKRYSCS